MRWPLNREFISARPARAGEQVAAHLFKAIESAPASDLTPARVDILRHRLAVDTDAFMTWWKARLDASAGGPDQAAWLLVGGRFGTPRLLAGDAQRLSVQTAAECQAALNAGASPEPGTTVANALLRAVLDGWCSDVATSGSSEAGLLLRAMRPQWYHQMQEDSREGPAFATGHLWLTQADRSSRAPALNRLVEIDQRYSALKKAANARGKGQKDTTEPWQNPARVLCQLHGPSLFAAEIAIAGAASRGTLGSGSVDPGGEPFGLHVDYGIFVIEVHRRPDTGWWQSMHGKYDDSLSRQTWCLALLATATTGTVIDNLGRIDSCLVDLAPEEFAAVAAAASRLGASQRSRTIEAAVWSAVRDLSNRTKLLVAHFAVNTSELDPLDSLTVQELIDLASPIPSAWPIVRAISSRLLNQPSSAILWALAAAGPQAQIDLPSVAHQLPLEYRDAILSNPHHYPAAWVIATERWRSIQNDETPLEQKALSERSLPKIPRL